MIQPATSSIPRGLWVCHLRHLRSAPPPGKAGHVADGARPRDKRSLDRYGSLVIRIATACVLLLEECAPNMASCHPTVFWGEVGGYPNLPRNRYASRLSQQGIPPNRFWGAGAPPAQKPSEVRKEMREADNHSSWRWSKLL